MNDLMNILNKIEDDTIIVTFIDYKYVTIFNIFYSYFKKLNLKNLLVIALDISSYNYLKKYSTINIFYIKYSLTNKDLFWRFRLSVINYIFKLSTSSINSYCF